MRDRQGSGGGGSVAKNQPFAAPGIHVGDFDIVLVARSNFKFCIQYLHEMFAIFDNNSVIDGMKMRRGVNVSIVKLQGGEELQKRTGFLAVRCLKHIKAEEKARGSTYHQVLVGGNGGCSTRIGLKRERGEMV